MGWGWCGGVGTLVAAIWIMTAPGEGLAQTEPAPDAYQEGLTLMQEGRIPEAIERFTRAAQDRPTVPAVWLALGQGYEIARRPAEAILPYRRVVELAPASPEAEAAQRRLDQLGRDTAVYEAAQRQFQSARDAVNARDLGAAESHLRSILDLLPKHLPSLLLLGVVLDNIGRSGEAQTRWEAAVAVDPAFYPAQVNLGRLYERTGQTDKAVAAYTAAVATRASSADVAFAARRLAQLGSNPEQSAQIREWLQGANQALQAGRASDATRFFEQVIAVLPTHAAANFGLALLAAKRGDTLWATGTLTRALAGDPDFYPASFLLGEIEAGRGRFQEAITHFTRVAELAGPKIQGIEARRRLPSLETALADRKLLEVGLLGEARASFNDGIEAFQRKEYEAAFKAFGKAMVLDEENPYYAFNRGLAAYNIGNSPVAANSFQRAIRLLPSYGLAHFWLGLLFQASAQQARDEGSFPEAQAEFRAAVERFDKAVEYGQQDWYFDEARARRAESEDFLGRYQEEIGHLTIAGALTAQGRLDEALAEFERAGRRFPWDFQPLLNIGAIHADRKAYDVAKAALERAAQINPRSPKPHNELGLLYERQELNDDAIAAYRKAVELAPNSPPPHVSIGTLLQQADDHAGAIAEFERAIELAGGTSNPLVHFRLAFSYNLHGQLSRALEQYRRTLKLLEGRTEPVANDLRNTASERAATLERSLRPYALSFSVTPWAYDTNINSSPTSPIGEPSMAFGAGIGYRLWDTETLQIQGSLNHSQSFFPMRGQNFWTTSLSLAPRYQAHPLVDFSANYQWAYSHAGLGPQSYRQSLRGTVTKRGELPSTMSLSLSYGASEGLGGATFQNANLGYSLSLAQSLKTAGSISVSYSSSSNDSNRADQLTQSQSVSISYGTTFWRVLSASWSYSVEFVDFVNPTLRGNPSVTGRPPDRVFRKSKGKRYGMDLSYVFRGDLTLSVGFGLAENETNVSLDRQEDLIELLTNEVRPDSSFSKRTLSLSVSKSF